MKPIHNFRLLLASLSGLLLGAATPGHAQCFLPPQLYVVGDDTPYSVAAGDFNADGILDLATANLRGDDVSVLLGNGDGTFGAAQHYGVGDQPFSVAVGDFNGDARPDLAVANANDDDVSVLLGRGDGTFGAAQRYGVGDRPLSVAAGDFNADGNLDLATANFAGDDVSVLLGRGDGTFGVAQHYDVGDEPRSVAVGDFNGDGKPDLAAANNLGATVSVLFNNGDGTFGVAQSYGVGIRPSEVAVGDFNGDARPDLATANANTDNLSVLLNNGDGTFAAAQPYDVGNSPASVEVGDFNADGILDLVTANLVSDDVSVLLGKGDGTFASVLSYGAGDGSISMAVGDFNGDARPDLVTTNLNGDDMAVLLNAAFTLSLSGAPLCAAQALTLTLTDGCPGVLEAQLSDANGSFASPVALGPVGAGSNPVVIPPLTPSGTGYRVRVVRPGIDVPFAVSAPFTVTALGTVSVALSPATPNRVCRGDALTVKLAVTGTCAFPVGNVFTVQLSNATGSFANVTVLGVAQVGTVTFPASLLSGLPVGTGYRVRVVSSLPALTWPASLPFRLEGPSLGVTPTVGSAPVCRGSAVTVGFSLPTGSCPFPPGNGFTAQLSSAFGSFTNPTNLGAVQPGVTNSLLIPAPVATGTGYRIRIVSQNPALTSPSSAPFQVRACTSRLSAPDPEYPGGPELVVLPNPVGRGNAFPGEIRCRVSMNNPSFSLTTAAGRSVGIGVQPAPSESSGSGGEWVLTPKQTLAPGVYVVQAREGQTRITRRVLVVD